MRERLMNMMNDSLSMGIVKIMNAMPSSRAFIRLRRSGSGFARLLMLVVCEPSY